MSVDFSPRTIPQAIQPKGLHTIECHFPRGGLILMKLWLHRSTATKHVRSGTFAPLLGRSVISHMTGISIESYKIAHRRLMRQKTHDRSLKYRRTNEPN